MKPWCLLLVCWATAALASAQLVTETFPLGAMTEAETTIILTHSISRDGKFILDRDKKTFTVTDTPEVLSILKAKLASRAQGQTMVRIEVLNQNQNNYRDQRWTSGPNV